MYRRTNLGWSGGYAESILVADSFLARLWGLGTPGVNGLIVWTRSVHTFGMTDPIWVLEVDQEGLVLVATLVAPRRVYRRVQPGLIVELKRHGQVPAEGDQLVALPSTNDGRNTHSLCNTHREPQRHDSAVG